jgi:hypothetical protein
VPCPAPLPLIQPRNSGYHPHLLQVPWARSTSRRSSFEAVRLHPPPTTDHSTHLPITTTLPPPIITARQPLHSTTTHLPTGSGDIPLHSPFYLLLPRPAVDDNHTLLVTATHHHHTTLYHVYSQHNAGHATTGTTALNRSNNCSHYANSHRTNHHPPSRQLNLTLHTYQPTYHEPPPITPYQLVLSTPPPRCTSWY